MSILHLLPGALNRRDEEPNIVLAIQIATSKNMNAVKELIEKLSNKKLQNDCIKVLYETGERNPDLITPYLPVFINLLQSKNNRLQWGAMTAIQSFSVKHPANVFDYLPQIMAAAQKGSVITTDNAVKTLVHLCRHKQYAEQSFLLLNELLLSSPTNQLPMYAELTLPVVSADTRKQFTQTLQSRLPDIEKETKRKRIEKVLSKLR